MHEVYKHGYSTLPNLRKLRPEEVFERDNSESRSIQQEKAEALQNQKCFMEHKNDPSFYEICEEWILKNYPRTLKGNGYLEIVREADEDFLIHRVDGDKDWLSSAHVCFPSHWRPEEKIGASFDKIHENVPMNLKNSPKLVNAIVHGGMFERFVWSVVYDNRYNFHPRLPHSKFNKEYPRVFVKVERQVTVGFPQKNFCLFVLRQYLIQEEYLDKEALAGSIEAMTLEQKKYKGLENSEDLMLYLRSGTSY